MRRVTSMKFVKINAHENLYKKMEEIRKMYMERKGINLSQAQVTNIISKRLMPIRINNINLLGDTNVKTKKKR